MRKKQKGRGSSEIAFSGVLKTLMEERHLTIAQVAALAGVSKSVAHDWSNGTNPHDLRAVGRLATALGISFRALLLGEPEVLDLPASLNEVFDEQDLFEGYCKVSVKKLNPRVKP